MAITYEWDIKQVHTNPTIGDNSDVIHAVEWTLTATDGVNNDADGNSLTRKTGSYTTIDTSDLSSFTAFTDITKATAIGWAQEELGADTITAIKSRLDAEIDEIVTPTSVIQTIGGS